MINKLKRLFDQWNNKKLKLEDFNDFIELPPLSLICIKITFNFFLQKRKMESSPSQMMVTLSANS
ncbi:hypothetical protein [Siminovitchia terrae]|uniref:hypothetical protein n=1 Tax=Siminovitchia terrae TaxID=1914933 RepID=UPI001BB3ED06|nr:hypothetical protein [Siminovitchia terrae]